MLKFDRDRAFDLLDVLREVAAARGATVAQISLAWLLGRKDVSSVLMGATKLHQLEDNLGAGDLVLSDDEMRRLDDATALKPLYPSSDWIVPDRRVAKAPGQKMTGRVAGKKALVTGGAQGLGAAIAKTLAVEGAQVVVSDLNAEGAAAIAAEINAAQGAGTATSISHDVTREEDWIAAIAHAKATMGGLSVLVNNARHRHHGFGRGT